MRQNAKQRVVLGLCQKANAPEAEQAARALCAWAQEQRFEVWADADAARSCGLRARTRAELAEGCALLVVLGGDGTLLGVARDIGRRDALILGVNLGSLGFLAELNPDEVRDAILRVCAGEYEVEARMRLAVRALRRSARGEQTLLETLALNDAVLSRSDLSRMMDIEARSDGAPISRYHGDGLIVATPTGSTAYTLSAGGPLLLQGARVFALTPICPHALSQRALVLPADMKLELLVHPEEGGAQLTVDGQRGVRLEEGDRVLISADAAPAHFVVTRPRSRFEVLRAKLGWGLR